MMARAMRSDAAFYRAALLRLLRDDSGQALVEYCVIMATLTILMMIAFRNVGTVANNAAGNNVSSMTNSSVVVP
jgi:Flp pilus assembly pilin Flp